MKILVGLGNPGKRYLYTRHNAGQIVLDELAFEALEDVELFKTDCFMNQSGVEVKKFLHQRNLKSLDLVVLHDDLDLPLGSILLQKGRGSAGHKGVESVFEALGTKDFWRLRIGIGRPPSGESPDEYVLERFSPPQLRALKAAAPLVKEKLALVN